MLRQIVFTTSSSRNTLKNTTQTLLDVDDHDTIGMGDERTHQDRTADLLQDLNVWLIIAVIHTIYAVVKLKPEKNSGLNGIRTRDLMGSNLEKNNSGFNFTSA